MGKIKWRRKTDESATAQQPQKRLSEIGTILRAKLKLGTTFKIATLNIKGMKRIGAREELEQWMKEEDIKILALQETRINTNSREARGSYTWYFSGEYKTKKDKEYTAGVGFVIDNKFLFS